MARAPKVKWSQLDPGLRTELEEILAARKAKRLPGELFYNDSDFLLLPVMVLIAALGAIGAGAYEWTYAYESGSVIGYLRMMVTNPIWFVRGVPHVAGVFFGVPVAIWMVVVLLRNVGRRGVAVTRHGLASLKGPRVRFLPYADIARSVQTQHATRKIRFTVMNLTMKDGQKETLYISKRLADEADARIAAAGGTVG